MDLDKHIVHIKTGKSIPKAGMTLEELKKFSKKDENGKPIILGKGTPAQRFDLIDETELLPRETVRNVILTCLDNYIVEEKKEGWQINNLGIIFSDEKIKEISLKEKYWKLLTKVLDKCSIYTTKEKEEGKEKVIEKVNENGVYSAWVIAQVKNELGLLELDDDYEDVADMLKTKKEDKQEVKK